MFVYDIFAFILISACHTLLYLQLIDYKLSWKLITALSICFTILLIIIVTFTGYPEMNSIVVIIFLLALGLMKQKQGLTFALSLYSALFSLVSITLTKTVLLNISYKFIMMSPINLYIWTGSLLNFISTSMIFLAIIIWQKQILKVSKFIVQSSLYYVIYFLLIIGMFILLILTVPSTNFLQQLNASYGEIGIILSFILFLVLLIVFLISSHLAKEQLIEEQQQKLDHELLNYVEKLEVLHDELASFRHDYINLLLSLDDGIRTKNMTQIEQVYRDTIAPTSQSINDKEFELVKLSRITIPEVKSVISVKVITAQQHNIAVLIDIPEKIDTIAMPLVKFIRMISIILDNAIEEAAKSDKRSIQIAFFEVDDTQRFIVQNSSSHKQLDLQKIYEKQYSDKGERRGYGLFSLKRMIDKAPNAMLETAFSYPIFTQIIALKKQ